MESTIPITEKTAHEISAMFNFLKYIDVRRPSSRPWTEGSSISERMNEKLKKKNKKKIKDHFFFKKKEMNTFL